MTRCIRASDLWKALVFCLLLFSVKLIQSCLPLAKRIHDKTNLTACAFTFRPLILKHHSHKFTRIRVKIYLYSSKCNTALQLVSKLLVLVIRDIRKLDIGPVAQCALRCQLIAALILPHLVHSQCQCQNHSHGASHDDVDLGWDVIRCALLRKGERTDDVAETERGQ